MLRLEELALLCDVLERLRHELVEPFGLLDQLLLHAEQIPVFANRLQEVVEELIELFSQVVTNEDDVVPEGDFMFAETCADLLIKHWLFLLNICQRSFDFLLQ